jgi:hypothetical protein
MVRVRRRVTIGPVWLLLATLGGCEPTQESGESLAAFIKEGDAIVATRVDIAKLAAVTRIRGNLIIKLHVDVASLVLPRLTVVEGSLSIQDVAAQAGPVRVELAALTRVGLDLDVAGANARLELVVPALTVVGGHLALERAAEMDMRAANLARVGGDVRFRDSGLSLIELTRLDHVGGGLRLERLQARGQGVDVVGATSPLRLRLILPALTAITGDLQVRSVPELTITTPLLKDVGGDFEVSGATLGVDLSALETVGGDLRVASTIIRAGDMPRLRRVGGAMLLAGVTFDPPTALTLPALVEVAAALEIVESGGLQGLLFPSLTLVGGRVRVSSVSDLQRLEVSAAVDLPSDFEVSGCGATLVVSSPVLQKLGGSLLLRDDGDVAVRLAKLEKVTGTVRIERAIVRDLELPMLAGVGEHFEIISSAGTAFETLALGSLASVGRNLVVRDAATLPSLELPALTGVGGVYGGQPFGSVMVTDNGALTSVRFPLLRDVPIDLVVQGNRELDSGVVMAATAPMTIGRKRSICGNRDALPLCD